MSVYQAAVSCVSSREAPADATLRLKLDVVVPELPWLDTPGRLWFKAGRHPIC